MALLAFAYASQASDGLSDDKIDRLSRDAASFNTIAGVTGLLLFDGSRFLQYLEGPEDGIETVYSRIRYASSHRDLVELAQGRVSRRRFPYWSMRWIPVEEAAMSEAAFSDWTSFAQRGPGSRTQPTGVDRLTQLAAPFIG
ncbi:BLUF domain-containing protein [Paracidovorax citrulli]